MTEVIINAINWRKNPRVLKAAAANNLTADQLLQRAIQEADGNAGWCSWKAGTSVTPRGSANLDVDIDAAIAADFTLTE